MNKAKHLSPKAKADIQGFITSGFGHLPFGAYLSVEIRERAPAQAWLRTLLSQVSTSTSWRLQSHAPKSKPDRSLNVAFTLEGLRALGLSAGALATFPTEFRQGMAWPDRARTLGDSGASAPGQWEVGGPQNPAIHAFLILGATTRTGLQRWCSAQRQALQRTQGAVIEHGSIAQYGERSQDGKEPFGFSDGMGQPEIEGIKGEGVKTGEFILGYENEYNFIPATPVALPADDPHSILPASANPYHQENEYRDLGMNGTYVVYRKLEQDVAGFWRFLQNESIRQSGEVDPQFMVWLAAKMVGRWPSGAPLVLAPDGDRPEFKLRDDFRYAKDDPDGLSCPLGSHIRRTNPRDLIRPSGPTQSLHMSARHRILRRGKPYGPLLFDTAILDRLDDAEELRAIVDLENDSQPRGLHFLCINTSIKSQFEFVQQTWGNNPRFNGLVNNRDPLVGDNDPSSGAPSVMHVPRCPVGLKTSPLPRFVSVRGGAYLFMPSLTALRFLAERAQAQ